MEQGDLNFEEFRGLHDFENIFDFVDEHHFLGTIDFRPVFEQAADDLRLISGDPGGVEKYFFSESRVFFEELDNAVR